MDRYNVLYLEFTLAPPEETIHIEYTSLYIGTIGWLYIWCIVVPVGNERERGAYIPIIYLPPFIHKCLLSEIELEAE